RFAKHGRYEQGRYESRLLFPRRNEWPLFVTADGCSKQCSTSALGQHGSRPVLVLASRNESELFTTRRQPELLASWRRGTRYASIQWATWSDECASTFAIVHGE